MVIRLNKKTKASFRVGSAREAYYNAISKFDGKTVDEFRKNCEASPPSVPGKGKLKDKVEPINGWVSWFARNKYIDLVADKK